MIQLVRTLLADFIRNDPLTDENLLQKRVYRQFNKYYSRGVKGSLFSYVYCAFNPILVCSLGCFSLGLAVPSGSEYRAEAVSPVDYDSVAAEGDNGWFSGTNWRLHPIWYCFCEVEGTEAIE